MQNMNYYYDFSGQKYNHPLSLSMNSFDRKVFSRQTSLEISFVLRGSYEVVTEHISHVLREQELVVISPNEIHILKKIDPDSVILILHIDFDRWNCQEKCSRINSLNSICSYAARSVSSCNNLYTAGG